MRRLGPAASLVICLAVLLFSTNQVKSYLLTSCATTRKHGNGSLRSRSNSTRIALSSLPDESEEAKYFDRFFELTMDMEDKYPKDNNLALINSVNLAKTLDNLVKLRQTDATATHSRIYELEQRVGQLESQIAEMRRMHLKLLQAVDNRKDSQLLAAVRKNLQAVDRTPIASSVENRTGSIHNSKLSPDIVIASDEPQEMDLHMEVSETALSKSSSIPEGPAIPNGGSEKSVDHAARKIYNPKTRKVQRK